MKNISETRTENFFRQEYGTTTFIEKSAIPSKYGFYSKKGTNYKGYPDFFLDQGEYCIVVEAKAENHLQAENEVKYLFVKAMQLYCNITFEIRSLDKNFPAI